MSRRIWRFEVPVDDRAHIFELPTDPLHVASSEFDRVEFWVEFDDDKPKQRRAFRVFGTGHDLPDWAVWVGTTDRTQGGFVWHLYEVTP